MYKFMIGTFLLLGWTFYELSGGSDFEPEQGEQIALVEVESATSEAVEDTVVAQEPVASNTITVTRPLIETDVTQASLEVPVFEDAPVLSLTEAVDQAAEAEEPATPATLTFEPVTLTASADVVDLRSVAGSRVNMRSGPGTDYGVLATLPRGTEAEVLEVDATGWARIRIIGSGQIGWMAERLLAQL